MTKLTVTFCNFANAPKAMTLPVVVCVCVCVRARARENLGLSNQGLNISSPCSRMES